MPEPIAYLNGHWLPQSQMALPVSDAGFVTGATVVDFVRTFRHQLDRWPEHLARFRESIRGACIDGFHYTDDELTGVAHELTRRNALLLDPKQELALIVFATPGRIGYYLGEADDGPATLGLHTFPLPFARYRDMVRRGAWLRVAKLVEAMPAACVPPDVKHRSRLHWRRAEREVGIMDGGASKALLVSAAGHVTETSFANVAIVCGNEIVSPHRATILPGLSLKMMEELCPEVGLAFHERDLTVVDCLAADAMLVCGTAFCLARVDRLNDTTLPPNVDALHRLLHAWNERVGLDIHAQFRGNEIANSC